MRDARYNARLFSSREFFFRGRRSLQPLLPSDRSPRQAKGLEHAPHHGDGDIEENVLSPG